MEAICRGGEHDPAGAQFGGLPGCLVRNSVPFQVIMKMRELKFQQVFVIITTETLTDLRKLVADLV